MLLKILLPSKVFSVNSEVVRINAETHNGSFGILPHRLDCIAALSPGILTYQIESQAESFVAIDEGILIKTGDEVIISVRRAFEGDDLEKLQADVEREFLQIEAREQDVRSVLEKMESGLIYRLAEYQDDQ